MNDANYLPRLRALELAVSAHSSHNGEGGGSLLDTARAYHAFREGREPQPAVSGDDEKQGTPIATTQSYLAANPNTASKIDELEAILNSEGTANVKILPDGRVVDLPDA